MTFVNARQIISRLATLLGQPKCELEYDSPWQLLLAVILSAQCTDKRVNIVTRQLFAIAPTADKLIEIPLPELERILHPVGFFRAKAKNVLEMSRIIVNKYDGKIPNTQDELVTLPGVGIKTANVILNEIFGVPLIAVDTHVGRVSRRLGFSTSFDPIVVEKDLYREIPPDLHDVANDLLLHFGRYHCLAKKPACERCCVREFCKYIDN